MKEGKYNKYKIKIVNSTFRCISANSVESDRFLAPDPEDKLPKLYVVKHGHEVCYVGITKQNIRSRLRYGLNAKGENGYWGYKWKHLGEVELLVWPFRGVDIEHVEAIEGELVFLIRERTGKWPSYQMEIHFHPTATEFEKRIAERIFVEITGSDRD